MTTSPKEFLVKRTPACVLLCALWSVLGVVVLMAKTAGANSQNARPAMNMSQLSCNMIEAEIVRKIVDLF